MRNFGLNDLVHFVEVLLIFSNSKMGVWLKAEWVPNDNILIAERDIGDGT
jgi:hypothetical protein